MNDPAIRVLVNGLHAKSGGGVTYLRHILLVLQSDPELLIHLVLHEDQRELFGGFGQNVRIHYVKFKNGFYRRLFWEQMVLPFLARRLGVQVTFSPANFGPLLAPGPVILLRNALAVSEVDRRLRKRLYWVVLAVMTRLSLIFCRRAIAVSSYALRSLSKGLGPEIVDRIHVIHHGVDFMFSPPPPGQPREHFLLCVGDIYVQKNLHSLIKAMQGALADFPDLRLKAAGRPVDEEYARMTKDLIKNSGLGGHVELLGHVSTEALLDLYRRCALFIQPSTVETFGNPLVEAMACGAPIISSNAAAMPEVLGQAALFFDPLDINAIAKSIVTALKDTNLRRELSQKSIARARDFSWDKTGRLTARIIKEASKEQ